MEEWRDIKGYEGLYQVSNLGRVRSRYKGAGFGGGQTLGDEWRLLAGGTDYDGYRLVVLCRDKARVTHKVHRLVAAAFIGPCPDGMEVCHNDGDPDNNRLENLRYDTPRNNYADRLRHGRFGTSGAKLCPESVRSIRETYERGRPVKELAEKHGVTLSAVYKIVRRHTWAWVE